ncbi:related to PAP1-poly(A) polymerase [Lecanosticta acicola]|uniref:Poly(A) polymerase n=1 Tax=Lecanosticta acicola TaxID=111012 RepID=A0AAI9E8C9_9PEZI|nr:related to PAP1-poly(A) polymerase [Lecanosticta acicola]
MAQNGEWPGVTDPLSLDPPSEQDLRLSEALMNELKAQNNFESREETMKRDDVLKKLQKLLSSLVQIVGKKKGIPQELLKEAGGKVFTYGSYRLGVYGPGSDIDSLMVAPKHVTREDFFKYMPDLIRKSVPPEELPELTPVPDANVPIIKLEMSGVSVDLIFSALQIASVPKTLELSDNNLLRGLDSTDMRCVNGTRVTDRILQLVPQSKIFRFALRAIKLWAQKRAIYGNVVGFPGGVAWGMLVARVCQLYPKAAASHIVNKFFFVISNWNWPKPIFLQSREHVPHLQEKEWDPSLYKGDSFHLMPVITPAFPCMNSTVSVGRSQRTVILQELARGRQITEDIYAGKKSWKDLFGRHTFFLEAYKHYICVITASKAKDSQHAWAGLVQARLRRLITGIEYSDADCVKLVHPFNKGFNGEHECKDDTELEQTFNGSLQYQVAATKTTDESADVKAAVAAQSDGDALAVASSDNATALTGNGPTKIWTTRYYLGIELQPGKTNLDISRPIAEFQHNCREWDGYREDMHTIRIKHVRNYDLPNDVFVEGETRPTKKKKTKKAKESTPAQEALPKKRSLNNAGLDENQDPAKRRQSGHAPGPKAEINGAMTMNGVAG